MVRRSRSVRASNYFEPGRFACTTCPVAGSARLDLIRRAASVSPGLTALAGALVVVSGLLPAAFSLATGALAQAVPPAVGQGIDSAPGRRLLIALVVASAVYVLIQVVGPVRGAVSEILMRRLDA